MVLAEAKDFKAQQDMVRLPLTVAAEAEPKRKCHMALKATKDAVRAICAADPSITIAQVKAALAELSGEGIREMQGEPPPRAYTREQVAALLGRSRRTVTMYARRGLLVPLYTGRDGKRAQAYTGESVAALLNGTATKGGAK